MNLKDWLFILFIETPFGYIFVVLLIYAAIVWGNDLIASIV